MWFPAATLIFPEVGAGQGLRGEALESTGTQASALPAVEWDPPPASRLCPDKRPFRPQAPSQARGPSKPLLLGTAQTPRWRHSREGQGAQRVLTRLCGVGDTHLSRDPSSQTQVSSDVVAGIPPPQPPHSCRGAGLPQHLPWGRVGCPALHLSKCREGVQPRLQLDPAHPGAPGGLQGSVPQACLQGSPADLRARGRTARGHAMVGGGNEPSGRRPASGVHPPQPLGTPMRGESIRDLHGPAPGSPRAPRSPGPAAPAPFPASRGERGAALPGRGRRRKRPRGPPPSWRAGWGRGGGRPGPPPFPEPGGRGADAAGKARGFRDVGAARARAAATFWEAPGYRWPRAGRALLVTSWRAGGSGGGAGGRPRGGGRGRGRSLPRGHLPPAVLWAPRPPPTPCSTGASPSPGAPPGPPGPLSPGVASPARAEPTPGLRPR